MGIGIENRDAIIEYSVFEVTKAEAWLPETLGMARGSAGLEVAQVDAGHAAVHLVHEEPAAVVVTLGLGQGRMMNVAQVRPPSMARVSSSKP